MRDSSEQVHQTIEFTYRWYAGLLADLRAAGYDARSFGDDVGADDVLLRHDVDLSLEAAVTMARIEAAEGVESTYFVLPTAATYDPLRRTGRRAVAEIASLGHDVGLHFSTHEYWNEEPSEYELIERVEQERDLLATVTGDRPSAVSFHRPPSWVLGREFEGFDSAYAPRYFEDVAYVADSGQRWREDPPAVDAFDGAVQLLAHPGLWGAGDGSFADRVERHVDARCRRIRQEAEREYLEGAR